MERVVDETANTVYRFCGILLVVVGLSMLSIRFFSEIPALKKKYQFLSDIGMTEDQMRREVRKEVAACLDTSAVWNIYGSGLSYGYPYSFYSTKF